MAAAKTKRPTRLAQSKERRTPSTLTNSAIIREERPGQRIVQFPQVKGKTTEKIEFFTSDAYHAITIDFEDKTSLNFAIKPGFTLNAELQQHKDEETEVLLEWPPIPSE